MSAEMQNPTIDIITLKIQGALGNGIDEHDWHPGEHWLDAAVRVLGERHALRAHVAELEAQRDRYRKALARIASDPYDSSDEPHSITAQKALKA